MKLYVLNGSDSEGKEVLGVYESFEDARKEAEVVVKVCRTRFDRYEVTKHYLGCSADLPDIVAEWAIDELLEEPVESDPEEVMREDMMGRLCEKCGEGHYNETRLQDDWDGVLHCDKCDHEVNRYRVVDNVA